MLCYRSRYVVIHTVFPMASARTGEIYVWTINCGNSPVLLASFIRPSISSSLSSMPRFLSINCSSWLLIMPSWSLSSRSNAVRKSENRKRTFFKNAATFQMLLRCLIDLKNGWKQCREFRALKLKDLNTLCSFRLISRLMECHRGQRIVYASVKIIDGSSLNLSLPRGCLFTIKQSPRVEIYIKPHRYFNEFAHSASLAMHFSSQMPAKMSHFLLARFLFAPPLSEQK